MPEQSKAGMAPSELFEQALTDELRDVLPRFIQGVSGVYAVSFYLETQHPDGPGLTLSFNTENTNVPPGVTPLEWRWNYAYWLQDPLLYVPQSKEGLECKTRWLEHHGLSYSGPKDGCLSGGQDDFESFLDRQDEAYEEFYEIVARSVHTLLSEDLLCKAVRRKIPIIIHDIEYSEQGLSATRRANPDKEVLEEFESFIASL